MLSRKGIRGSLFIFRNEVYMQADRLALMSIDSNYHERDQWRFCDAKTTV